MGRARAAGGSARRRVGAGRTSIALIGLQTRFVRFVESLTVDCWERAVDHREPAVDCWERAVDCWERAVDCWERTVDCWERPHDRPERTVERTGRACARSADAARVRERTAARIEEALASRSRAGDSIGCAGSTGRGRHRGSGSRHQGNRSHTAPPNFPRSPIPRQGKKGSAEKSRSRSPPRRPITDREHEIPGAGNGERKKPHLPSSSPSTRDLSLPMPAPSA